MGNSCGGKGEGAPKSPGVKIGTDDSELYYKVLVIGDAGVGKSSLLLRFVDDVYTDAFISTLGVDFKTKTVTYSGEQVKLQIWDTAGQERFRTITSSYYRGAQGIIVAYDISNPKSFSNVARWCREIETFGSKNVKKVLVGNKTDLADRKVTIQEGENMAAQLQLPFIETSTKENVKVEEAFMLLVKEMVKK